MLRLWRRCKQLEAKGHYRQAIRYARKLMAIGKQLEAQSPGIYTGFLNRLATLYYKVGDHRRAKPLFERALAIRIKRLKPGHPLIATSLSNLASLYRSLGDYARAEPLFRRALAIDTKGHGPDHPQVASVLSNLALLYKVKGQYALAQTLYQRALAIRIKRLGQHHPDVATVLNNLANVYESKGDYGRAELLYLRALAIYKKRFRPDHPRVAAAVSNLALLYHMKGDYARAEPLYRRALAIDTKVYGPAHPEVATILNNLAALFEAQKSYARAEPLRKRVYAIFIKHLPANHPHLAGSLNNLALLYLKQHKYARVEPLLRRALAMFVKRLGRDHPRIAIALNNLGLLYKSKGDLARAEPLYKRAHAIFEKKLGSRHPHVAVSLQNLAELHSATGRAASGWKYLHRAATIRLDRADLLLPPMSERAREAYLARLGDTYEMLLTLAATTLKKRPSARRQALELVLRYKGILLASLRHQRELAATSRDPKLARLVAQRNGALRYLNLLVMRGQGQLSARRYRVLLAQARKSREQAEERLARTSARINAQAKLTLGQVARTLGPRDALVELVRFRARDFKATRKQTQWKKERYAAFVLRGGSRGKVALVDLGPAARIDGLVRRYRRAIVKQSVQVAHQRDLSFALRWLKKRGQKLYARVMAPLAPYLGKAKRLWISPAGALGRLPLELLVRPDGKYLGQVRQLSLLGSGRDLIRLSKPAVRAKAATRRGPTRAMALVAPKYGRRAGTEQQLFGALKWKARDSRRLRKLLARIVRRRGKAKVTILGGSKATEARLRQVHRPLLLHLYTHGFYLSDHQVKRWAARRYPGAKQRFQAKADARRLSDPMRRSGLALAGANVGFSLSKPAAKKAGSSSGAGVQSDDGILTAEEVGALDLTGTALVVLGACQTGIGKLRGGQGIYGLRRALLYAGARSLLVSLWRVPEKQTRKLLFAFYRALAAGKSKRAALRRAQAHLRRTHPLPYHWSGFVLVGDPGRIR